jgi:hypothetical protein
MRHWPIQFRAGQEPPKKKSALFWDFQPCLFRNSTDGPYYDVIVTRGDVDPIANDPPGPSWRVAAVVDRWRVLEKVPGSMHGTPEEDRGPCPP